MNPEFSTPLTGQQSGVSPSNPINDPSFNVRLGSNTYDLSYQNLLTARYGDVTPFFYYKAVGRDRVELRSAHELRTYTLGAPLMSGLRMRKSQFSVSKKCMMPNTYDYLFVNPVKGDDVPNDAYQSIDVCKLCSTFVALYNSALAASDASMRLKIFVLFSSILSPGGLPDLLGMSLYRLANTVYGDLHDDYSVVDDAMEKLVDALVSSSKPFVISFDVVNPLNGSEYQTSFVSDGTKSIVFEMLQQIMLHPDCQITVDSAVLSSIDEFMSRPTALANWDKYSVVVNIYKIIAYQMILAQFYSNDHVDPIYNSDLWLSNMKQLQQHGMSASLLTFDYNGVAVYYDVFSSHLLTELMKLTSYSVLTSKTENMSYLYFWFNLFAIGRSLRYGDYFMSTRPRPLAVGDVSVPVTGNNVSVIDINKNLHIQRFLNAVNRSGSSLVEYAKQIFGYSPKDTGSHPNFISSEVSFVGSDEIDNTAESQGQVNVNLIGQQNQYMFDVDITDECYILGLISFECTGAYRSSIERDNFHVTRFDDFIPELQHIGDQVVYQTERDGVPSNQPYGYQVRYAEFKFKYNQMHGGFCTNSLKNWAFPVDTHDPVINEFTIRSLAKDFDPYYKSLTGGSLSSRFHFQISFANNVRANRPIDYQPSLL